MDTSLLRQFVPLNALSLLTLNALAEIRGIDPEAMEARIALNYRDLFAP